MAPVGIAFALFLFVTQHQRSPQLHNLTFTILGAGVTVVLVYVGLYICLFGQTTLLWLGWAVLGAGLVISVPICYLACKVRVIGCIVAGLASGVSLGMVLQVAVVYMINYAYSIYIVSGALCLIMIGLCIMFDHHAINVANAITSSYVIMRCIGLTMNYPYELAIYYEQNLLKTAPFDPYVYIYIGGFVAGVLVSSLFKFKLRSMQFMKEHTPYYVIN